MDRSIANLHLLFKHIGSNHTLVNYTETDKYSSIQTMDSAWPNAIFNFNNDVLQNESEWQNLSSAIIDKKLPALCMVCSDGINSPLLKKYGFYTIEQWRLMSFDLDENPAFRNSFLENYNFGLVKSEYDLNGWVDTVRNSLFQNKQLDKNIFLFLSSSGSELIYIRKYNEIVGAAMVYYDQNETAGIYMVCINPEERGFGLGKALVIFTLEQIKKRKINKIVLQSTKAGLNLYLKTGFTASGICNLIYKIK